MKTAISTNSLNTVSLHRLRVTGLVQGVGFRPTVWRIANSLGLSGSVYNDGQGVLINCLADNNRLQAFIDKLTQDCPPLARIDDIVILPADEASADKIIYNDCFHIIESEATCITTGVVADAATCEVCLQELFDQNNRRYHYPFLNCTHCGPRFSIMRKIPYDRANTSMCRFSLCQPCEQEYRQPTDRRFHAQPTACTDCGPQVGLYDNQGQHIDCADAITEAARRIINGQIIAIKGIGGIHLACDAANSDAIARLRQRKQRPHKPLALMAKHIEHIRQFCAVNQEEASALAGSAAPIVILDSHSECILPDNLAPGQRQLGFMLPYSPLHHLLMAELTQPIVLTSGNLSDEPQCIDNDDTLKRLQPIADAFLLHNRAIENRIDDSVVRFIHQRISVLRRARGYAPGQIRLPEGFDACPAVLAFGGELKSTFCLLQHSHAILSQHMGNLEDARTFDDYRKNLDLYQQLYDHQAVLLAADKHPEYLSSKLAADWADDLSLPLTFVQHHHAHIAACMIDNDIGLNDGPVIGVAFDGLGFGEDGSLWGGEFLLADYLNYQRLAHLKAAPMPGAAQAMREPWRNTWAQLHTAFDWNTVSARHPSLVLTQTLASKPLNILQNMLDKQINTPLTTSCGRLFDAVAAAIGVAPEQCSFEGRAAMVLEACVDPGLLMQLSPYDFALSTCDDDGMRIIDPTSFWQALLDDLENNTAPPIIATRFHLGLANIIIETASLLAVEHATRKIALSGGVFQNRTLLEIVADGLLANHFTVLTHHDIPANDGGIALGQAAIAAARHITGASRFNSLSRESSCV